MDGKRWLDLLTGFCEVSMLLALAALGLALLPLFCVSQAVKGDPWWFWPKKQPPPRRGGFWDHP